MRGASNITIKNEVTNAPNARNDTYPNKRNGENESHQFANKYNIARFTSLLRKHVIEKNKNTFFIISYFTVASFLSKLSGRIANAFIIRSKIIHHWVSGRRASKSAISRNSLQR